MQFFLVLAMLVGTSYLWAIGATTAGFCWIGLWLVAAVLWMKRSWDQAEKRNGLS